MKPRGSPDMGMSSVLRNWSSTLKVTGTPKAFQGEVSVQCWKVYAHGMKKDTGMQTWEGKRPEPRWWRQVKWKDPEL